MASLDKPVGLFDDFYQPFGSFFSSAYPRRSADQQSWLPAVDISKQEGGYLVEVEVPGFQPEDIEVEAHDQVLTVRGKRSSEIDESNENYVHRERRVGQFVRRFNLPAAVDSADIKAQVTDGVLRVTIPGTKEATPQKIAVQ